MKAKIKFLIFLKQILKILSFKKNKTNFFIIKKILRKIIFIEKKKILKF